MTTEEQRLSQWLHKQTPEPPHLLSLRETATRAEAQAAVPARRRAPATRWAAVVAAAAVVAFVAALLTNLQGRGHDLSPATPSPSATMSTTRPRPTPTPGPAALAFRPWNARLIVSDEDIPLGLSAIGSYLYGVHDALVRINPATGRTEARQPISEDVSTTVVAAADRIWTVAVDAGTITLAGYDPLSLRPLVRRGYALTGRASGLGIASRGATLYIAAGNRVIVVDARTARTTSSFDVSDGLDSVSVTPDGRRVVVATASPDGPGVIEVLDARNGQRLEREQVYGCGELLAVNHGFFVTCGQGMSDQVTYQPFQGSTVVEGGGGGGISAAVQLSGEIAWLGGPQVAACIDPDTGHVRAHVTVNTARGAALTGMSVVHGRLYAVYFGLNNNSGVVGLVELTPPKACGLR